MKKYETPEFSIISLESQNDILLSPDPEQGGVGGDADTGGGEEED